jgi:hypothetical protein
MVLFIFSSKLSMEIDGKQARITIPSKSFNETPKEEDPSK